MQSLEHVLESFDFVYQPLPLYTMYMHFLSWIYDSPPVPTPLKGASGAACSKAVATLQLVANVKAVQCTRNSRHQDYPLIYITSVSASLASTITDEAPCHISALREHVALLGKFLNEDILRSLHLNFLRIACWIEETSATLVHTGWPGSSSSPCRGLRRCTA